MTDNLDLLRSSRAKLAAEIVAKMLSNGTDLAKVLDRDSIFFVYRDFDPDDAKIYLDRIMELLGTEPVPDMDYWAGSKIAINKAMPDGYNSWLRIDIDDLSDMEIVSIGWEA